MAEFRDDVWVRRSNAAATVLIFAAAIGIPYACDRAYRQWMEGNDPFAWLGLGLERARTGYRDKRDNVTDVARFINEVFAEVARATSNETAR